MAMSDFLWMTLAAFLTLATFSFLYKDNPLYKIAEHLVVGVSAGYFVIILYYGSLEPQLFDRLVDGKWWYWIPLALGMLMWTRFSRKLSWVSRYPIAIYIGIATGLAIPLEMQTKVNEQLLAMMTKLELTNFFGMGALDHTSSFAQALVIIGSLSALVYFYFSKEHSGWFGGVARVGIWTLMLGFGASFGYTVMARISLLINRVQSLDTWRQTAFGSETQTGATMYQVLYLLVIGGMLTLLMVDFVRTKGKTLEDLKAEKAESEQ